MAGPLTVVERYHLMLAAWAVGAGLVCAAASRMAPSFVQHRLVALAGLTGAVLGAWNDPRGWPWLVAAALVLAWADDPGRPHPLGEWAAPLAVVSLIGVWASVPDTEPALAAGAVLAPLALALAVTHRPVGPAGTIALGVAVLGPVWVGSAGWGAALATVSAIGVVVAAPLVDGFRRATLSRAGWAVVVAAQVLIALPLSRVIMRQSVVVAVMLSAMGLTASLLVMTAVVVPRVRPPSGARPEDN